MAKLDATAQKPQNGYQVHDTNSCGCNNNMFNCYIHAWVNSCTIYDICSIYNQYSGRIYDKTKNIRKLLFVCGLLMSIGVAGIAFTTGTSFGLNIAGVSNVLVGVFSAAVFTIAYASSNIIHKKGRMEMTKNEDNSTGAKSSFDTLAISWVNGLSLFGAFWVPILFSLLFTM
jgi:hypothetical protein